MRAIVFALLLAGCTVNPVPLTPSPGPGDCETACENISEFGGCGIESSTCVPFCERAEKNEAESGVRFPVHCLTVAANCEEVARCR